MRRWSHDARGQAPAGRPRRIGSLVRLLRFLVTVGWLTVPLLPLFALTGFGRMVSGARALLRAWSS
ncbi:hypothetical protein ASF49_21370 [Methylobacterium sp. Leaf104]|nr:hypothetical protein ASF49_21370 [Methylobacterium sp. Leaf104]